MRAARALAGERDYMAYAQAANGAGLAAEAKAVLDEGVSRRMVDPAKSGFKELIASAGKKASADRAGLGAKQSAAMAAATGTAALAAGDSYFAYGDYAAAATLYRAALQKGGADVGSASVRLGAALALAGQRAEAESHLRSVTGPGADLAAYWLAWLRRPA
jgi:tetratricopeptide (TPR) repeat protein